MTQHATDDDLILHFYGERLDSPELEQHVAHCPECRARFGDVQRTLHIVELPVPERGLDYGTQVWSRLAPKLGIRVTRRPLRAGFRQWMAIAASLAIAVVAFVAGRHSWQSPPQPPAASVSVRDRVLIAAVGDHLERSSMVLVELVNSQPKRRVDIGLERETAEGLIEANRLYRQTAAATGETAIAGLLDDLERVLLEVVHSPDAMSVQQFQELRDRVEQQGLVFKIRVVESQLRDRVASPRSHTASQL